MKAESMQSPVDKYKITIIDNENAEVEFFDNILKKTKKEENSERVITYYEYDYYRILLKNRTSLSEQIKNNYAQWLEYAISKDDSIEKEPTPLEVVQSQYNEYSGMDTPSTIEEMKQQDPTMATEYINMMIELRALIYTLSVSEQKAVGYSAIHIPIPSDKLKEFKNKFKLTK